MIVRLLTALRGRMFPTRVGGKSVRIDDMRRGKISAKIVGIRLTIGRLLLF
jgi:hypothetical protein